MPQLEISTFPSQIFWLCVSFIVLYILLSSIVIPKISSVIKGRETEIKNNINNSEKLYIETEKINDEFEKIKKETENKARSIINSLKESTNKKIAENNELLKKNLEKKLEKSELEINAKKKSVLKNINKITLDISQEIVKKLSLDKNINKKKLIPLIKKNIKEID
tara:strand:- start:833 stop:1327 length:495 start_codon:yes stop_codon:yes gene_type:complete